VENLSTRLLAIAVMIELVCLVAAARHPDLFTVSIEATELWPNPWPAPGDPPPAANGPCRIPSSVCVPEDNSQPRASKGVGAAF
jgi:hypothetical protein